jgi:hypothetical protein
MKSRKLAFPLLFGLISVQIRVVIRQMLRGSVALVPKNAAM